MSLTSINVNNSSVAIVNNKPSPLSGDLVKSGNINSFIFADLQPYIKELYINEIGKLADVATIHNVYASNGTYHISFSNTAKNAFTAYTGVFTNTDDASRIIPIFLWLTETICGYIIIDWNLINGDFDPTTSLNSIAYNIDYSPSIKLFLTTDDLVVGINNELASLNNEVFKGDTKIFDTINREVSDISCIWVLFPKIRIKHINNIRYKSYAGTTKFYIVTYNTGNEYVTFELIGSIDNDSSEDKLIKELPCDVELEENQYIGIGGSCYWGQDTESQGFQAITAYVSDGHISSRTPSNQVFAFEALYIDINDSIRKVSDSTVTLLNDKLNSSKSYIAGTQTFGTFGLIVNNKITINKHWALVQKSATFLCKFALNTIAYFQTCLINLSITSIDTKFTIDISEKTIQCSGLVLYYCEFLTSDHLYAVTMERNYNVQKLIIVDITIGESREFTWINSGTGGVGSGAIGNLKLYGCQYDLYLLDYSGSPFEVSQVLVQAPKADLIIYGDSITDSSYYYPATMLHEHWTLLILDKMGTRAVVSARGGYAIQEMYNWMQNEIPFIKPKYVMITIGTNGGLTVSGLTNVILYIKNQGCIPILNHIPANINSGGISNHIEVNQVIDTVRTSENVTGADFDIVTAINMNPASGVNTVMMWKEEYPAPEGIVYHHPNKFGSCAMFNKLLLDVPLIFE